MGHRVVFMSLVLFTFTRYYYILVDRREKICIPEEKCKGNLKPGLTGKRLSFRALWGHKAYQIKIYTSAWFAKNSLNQ